MRLPRGGPFGTVPADTHEHAKLVPFARSRRRRYRDVHGRAHAPADCQSHPYIGLMFIDTMLGCNPRSYLSGEISTASSRRRAAGARRLAAAGVVGRNA